ncbi:hypothetical protein GCM10010171_57670 [Actinokineospora fastidiosa]|uniref:Uncharacterized protein n=1 Tax=Actinokineospora fastidiosa TaxID=1816 RepID=A0A918GQN0_9PSEU|nr:hypothetical protein GCM10010171_57670 [Actinokineospora fastidiosa]
MHQQPRPARKGALRPRLKVLPLSPAHRWPVSSPRCTPPGEFEQSAAFAELRGHFPGSTAWRSALDSVVSDPDGVDIALLDGLKKITVDVVLRPSA